MDSQAITSLILTLPNQKCSGENRTHRLMNNGLIAILLNHERRILGMIKQVGVVI